MLQEQGGPEAGRERAVSVSSENLAFLCLCDV